MKNKILILLIFINQFAYAQLELINKVGHTTPAFVKTYNDTLFVSNDALLIYDVSGNQPEQIGQIDLSSGYLQEIQYHNKKIYAAYNENGIIVYDASEIDNITATDTLFTSYNFCKLKIYDESLTAIAKMGNSLYLTIIDIHDLEITSMLNITDSSLEPKNTLVDDSCIYLTYGHRNSLDSSELHIMNHNSFQSLEHMYTLNIGKSDFSGGRHKCPILAIAKSNNYLYITGMFRDPNCDIKIIDIENKENPKIIKCWGDGHKKAVDIAIQDQFIFLTNTQSELFSIQIQNDTTLNILSQERVPMPNYYNHDFLLNTTNDKAFLNNWDNYAVFAIDISNANSLENLYSIEYGHDWRDVCISENGDKLFAAVWNCYQLYTIDVSNPDAAYIENRKELFGSGWGVESSGNFIYSAMGDTTVSNIPTGGMIISQITDSIPEVISWLPPRQGNHDVQINIDQQNKLAYIISGQPTAYTEEWENHSSHNPGLRIVSLEQITDTLQEISFLPLPYQCRDIHSTIDKIYIVATDTIIDSTSVRCGLYQINKDSYNIYNIKQEWHPEINTNRKMFAVYSTPTHVYCGYGNSILCFSVDDFSEPLMNYQLDDICMDIFVENEYLIAISRKSLYILKHNTNESFVLTDSISNAYNSEFRHLTSNSDNIFVQTSSGINIFNKPFDTGIEDMSLKQSITIFPNPFNSGFSIEFNSLPVDDIMISVFDISGKLMAKRKENIASKILEINYFNLKSGIYFIQIETYNTKYVGKIVKY